MYKDSAAFTEEFHTAMQKLREATELFAKPEMEDWFRATDRNYDTATNFYGLKLNEILRSAATQSEALADEIERAV